MAICGGLAMSSDSAGRWPSVRLDKVADLCLGKMLDKEKNKGLSRPYLANINVRWGKFALKDLREMLFEEREFDRYGLRFGDIVMCEGGEPGRCAIWSDEIPGMMIQKALHRIRPKKGVDSHYLYYALANGVRSGAFDEYMTGSGIKHLPGNQVAKLEVFIPPLDEQMRIAEVLRSVDKAVASAEAVSRQWGVTFDTLLDAAFLKGTPVRLADICSLIYRYPGFYGFDQLSAGVPVVRGEHLRSGRISNAWEDFYFVDPAFSARFPKTILEHDDVIMAVRGTVGTTAIVDAAHVGSQISPNLIRLVADPAKIMPPLLYYAVQSAVAHIRRTIVNAQALPAINAGDLKQVKIALPALTDQPALLAELNGAAIACADAVSATQQAWQTKVMIMSDLLSGHVQVPA